MHIFLTGATGYVGARIARRLLENGHTVSGLARSSESAAKLSHTGVTPHEGDLARPETLAAGAKNADGVIHTAFGNDFDNFGGMVETDLAALEALVGALAGTGKPLIASNGSAFLGDTGDALADETRPADETSYFAPRARPDRRLQEAASQHNLRAAVLRLPFFVYGDNGSVFAPALLHFARQAGRSIYVGAGDNRASAVHVEDAARAYVLALEKATPGAIYHLADGSGPTFRQIAHAVSDNLGVPIQSVDRAEAEAVWGPGLTAFFTISNQLDASKARRELGWEPAPGRPSLLDDLARGSYKAKE